MTEFEIPERARRKLAEQGKGAVHVERADPMESTTDVERAVIAESTAPRERLMRGGYSGFVCYSCRCPVDTDMIGDHTPECEYLKWWNRTRPTYDGVIVHIPVHDTGKDL